MYKNASKTMNINLEYYKVFYYVCTAGSLTAAAQKLCISQPAVSQAVRQLEKEAGTRLFLRTSKGIRLTREGELLFRYVKTGVEQLLEGGRMLERMLDMDKATSQVTACRHLATAIDSRLFASTISQVLSKVQKQ